MKTLPEAFESLLAALDRLEIRSVSSPGRGIPWSDVVGMWNAAGPQADIEYLQRWAKRIGADDLLEKLTGR